MKTSSLLALATLLIFSSAALGQNLVPNGSFEEFVDCPEGLADLQAAGWSQARGSCDYYNACADQFVSVPGNVNGYQEALEGNAYAGFQQYETPFEEYRELMTCELLTPLVAGEQYFFSMYINRGDIDYGNKNSNGQGFYLTHEFHSSLTDDNPTDNPSPFQDPNYYNEIVVSDSTNWVQIKSSFIAEEDFSYLVIGAFLNSEMLEISDPEMDDSPGAAYYFIDEVRLSTDMEFAWEILSTAYELSENNNYAPLYPNPTNGRLFLDPTFKGKSVMIFDPLGRMIGVLDVEKGILDLSLYPDGVYLISFPLESNNHSIQRVIKN